jgi:hypothetical protein
MEKIAEELNPKHKNPLQTYKQTGILVAYNPTRRKGV